MLSLLEIFPLLETFLSSSVDFSFDLFICCISHSLYFLQLQFGKSWRLSENQVAIILNTALSKPTPSFMLLRDSSFSCLDIFLLLDSSYFFRLTEFFRSLMTRYMWYSYMVLSYINSLFLSLLYILKNCLFFIFGCTECLLLPTSFL